MKKILLTLCASVLFAGTALGFDAQRFETTIGNRNLTLPKVEKAPMKAATKEGYDLKFCNDIYSWYYLSQTSNLTYKCYIYIPEEIATELAGNELTSITFSVASQPSVKKDGTIFVTEDLAEDPVTSTKVTVIDAYGEYEKGRDPFQTETLETPYVIKEGTGFYFGYTVEKCKVTNNGGTYPVGIDGYESGSFAGAVDLISADGSNLGTIGLDEIGSNLFLSATTIGEKKAVNNVFNVLGVLLGDFAMPVTNQLKDKQAYVVIDNYGSNDLTSINYTASVTGGETITKDATINVAANSYNRCSIALPDYVPGKGVVSVTINKVNDILVNKNYEGRYIAIEGEGYPRKFVVEEGTGTWCGWCPRGIVGFEYMEENYPDTFIGIAAHYGDEMSVESYDPLFNYVDGFPGCLINRDLNYLTDPSASILQQCYDIWSSQIGAAELKIETSSIKEDGIDVEVTTTFAFDDSKCDYRLALIITEDQIAGVQSNYYSGGGSGECGGWEKMKQKQAWMYSHVARDIFDFYGLESSSMTNVVAGQPSKFSTTLSWENVYDPTNTRIIAILIDDTTGSILNAAKIEAENYGTTGINEVMTEATAAPVEYYNLQGIRMAGENMPAGIYIMRQGNEVKKMIR